MRILVTGGAGFIGTHVVDELITRGDQVVVLDALIPQVHSSGKPAFLSREAELQIGDIRDAAAIEKSLVGVEAVVHLAAEVGVGQSMYEMHRYVDVNSRGTALLLDAIARRRGQIRKLVVASSMSIYGEGAYRCGKCGAVNPTLRPEAQLATHNWEVACPTCGGALEPAPTSESKPLFPTSIYAVTKQDQEQMCLIAGRAYGVQTVALRFFNVYGPRQALSNPYTGVAAIFSARLLNGHRPMIFEDGKQSRDFIHVSDIAAALLLALDSPRAVGAYNAGTGRATSVAEVARLLAGGLKLTLEPDLVGKYREGDIRHCIADPAAAARDLGFRARRTLDEGIPELLDWVRRQRADDKVAEATNELAAHKLVR